MEQNIILWDGLVWENLLPFTFTRPLSEIRTGILTISEKYKHYFGATPSPFTADYLQKKFPVRFSSSNLLINASVLPDAAFAQVCSDLTEGESLFKDEIFLAARLNEDEVKQIISSRDFSNLKKRSEYNNDIQLLDQVWKIFQYNDAELRKDFDLLTKGRTSLPIPESNFVAKREDIFIEEGAKVEFASLNATSGPIYIGKDAEVMEGSLIRGPFALGEHSSLKLGAKIYGATTIGPHCKVGGEVNNCVIFGYSNKAHDGFIGNAVIGEWCNLGADSNNSNLKNNYEEVKIWSYKKGGFIKTGLQFCGLFMGDHSKCGINTMFNTGTVVGVSANIFGAGFPRNFVPSFSWGGAAGFSDYRIDKALETAAKVFERRGIKLDETEKEIFEAIYNQTNNNRNLTKE